MKKLILITTLALTSSLSAWSQELFPSKEKKGLLKEITQYYKGIVSVASYDVTTNQLFNAMVVTVTKNYSEIVRESEKKGFIDARNETAAVKETITAEIRGDEPPMKVSFLIKKQERKQVNGVWGNWTDVSPETLEDKLVKIQRQLYEELNGVLQLPTDLLAKLEAYNKKQKKEKKRITKGIDY